MTPMMEILMWVGLLILFVIFEAATVQLVSAWFAVGALGGLIANLCGASIVVQVTVFVVVSIVSLILTRPIVKKFTKSKIQKTNVDRCIGAEAVVIEEINNLKAYGQAKVNGIVWSARSSDDTVIPEDSIVIVEKIEGVKLIVKKK